MSQKCRQETFPAWLDMEGNEQGAEWCGMKIGDQVEVVAVPESLPSGMGTQALFEACVGRVFPIEGIDNGFLELHVGEVVGEASCMHSIWIEPSCVLLRR